VRQLADWGADVVKIEAPATAGGDRGLGGPRHGSDFQNLHRNKRSLTLNLKSESGRAVFLRMVDQADVVVENYRPAVKTRLGIDYETLAAINPGLVYGSLSGFGQTGPYADRPGFDQVAQGMGGLMSVTGLPGQGPVRAGIPIADLSAGLFCAMGILVALLEREISGQGQWVQTSLLQAQIAMMDFQAARWTMDGQNPGQAGNNHPTAIPTGVFQTSDGHINVATAGDESFRRLAKAIGAPNLSTDDRFGNGGARIKNRDVLNAEIGDVLVTKSSDHWINVLNAAGVPCGRINSLKETFQDPQVQHLGAAQGVNHPVLGDIELIGQAFTLSRTPSQLKTAAPEPGQHTEETLGEYGFSKDEIALLRAEQIV
jgi:formyl-CoA transferase